MKRITQFNNIMESNVFLQISVIITNIKTHVEPNQKLIKKINSLPSRSWKANTGLMITEELCLPLTDCRTQERKSCTSPG